MRQFVESTKHATRACRVTSTVDASWFWQLFGITVLIWLGLASEGLAATTVRPTALTYYGMQGATTPPNQTITVYKDRSNKVTLSTSDNASWLTVSPATTSMGRSANLTVAVNISGLVAGTYQATITIKVGTWDTITVPVRLILSPAATPPPSTTSSVTLAWDAVTSTTISGYKVYVGEAPGLYSRDIDVGTVTSYTVTSLTVGRMYYFAVTAYNSGGESTRSNEVSKTVQ